VAANSSLSPAVAGAAILVPLPAPSSSTTCPLQKGDPAPLHHPALIVPLSGDLSTASATATAPEQQPGRGQEEAAAATAVVGSVHGGALLQVLIFI
jgi:hypothetical protein